MLIPNLKSELTQHVRIINYEKKSSYNFSYSITKIIFYSWSATEENFGVLDKIEHADSKSKITTYPARQNLKL